MNTHVVSKRLYVFIFDLLRDRGGNARDVIADLPSFAAEAEPDWISWSDYVTLITRLTEIAGGSEGVARAMRATVATAYADLRALAGFFPSPVAFFSFTVHHLMAELCPCVIGKVEALNDRNIRVRYRIADGLEGSVAYHHGTVTLLELFPTHFGLSEARVEVVKMTEHECELLAEFPVVKQKSGWDEPARLSPREHEILRHVCQGLTNAEIATALGTAVSTVRNQISSILVKMDAANRTELAARATREGIGSA